MAGEAAADNVGGGKFQGYRVDLADVPQGLLAEIVLVYFHGVFVDFGCVKAGGLLVGIILHRVAESADAREQINVCIVRL